MNRLKTALAAGIMVLLGSMTAVSAHSMMLVYDGAVHEYRGSVYSLVVNNQLLEPPMEPIIFNEHALVPVREIFEEMGATVSYDDGTIVVENSDTYVLMNINDNIAYVNGKKTKIPDNVVPKLISKVGGETKTMVPVRFISETMGMDVEFNSDYEAILIDTDDYSALEPDTAYEAEEVYTPESAPVEEVYAPADDYVYEEPKEISDVSYEVTGDNSVRITVATTSGADISAFTMSDPERVVVDFAGFKLSGISDMIVGEAGISKLRFGDNDERARVVADVDGKVTNLSAEAVSENEVVIEISTKPSPTPTPYVPPTPKPQEDTSGYISTVTPDASKLIILDAGHGGTDSGAVGTLNGSKVLEKDLTLAITYKVKNILESKGYTTLMTREGDTLPSLVERPTMANEANAAIFVSIHINSCDSESPNGVEVYYSLENNGDTYGTTSEVFAENLLERMQRYMKATNRGVKTANHAVTRRCNMPASLVEIGFISNTRELELMCTDEYQDKAAEGIAEGIMITLEDITVPNN